MACCGEREKLEDADAEQKWSYINLRDFTSTSCLSHLSYAILYVFILISGAVYAVDCFTAVNLLFFNRWSGQVKPVISFKIARWIFAACILLSLVLLVYRWVRALRVIKSGVIAASYLDPLAVRIQCVRVGAMGQGWRRFLVFAALTEGRKGAEYVALFTYFSFEAWMRIIFAQGPRQLLNAQTLYSVMQADLVPAGEHAAKDGHSAIAQFWINLRILANHNKEQAAILFGMLFTLVIWVFSVISLLLACIFYITFLWHHVPKRDGSLTRYCRRKIDTRLSKIVTVKVNKALAKEDELQDELQARQGEGISKRDRAPHVKRQPTLPQIEDDDHSTAHSILTRQATQDSFSTVPFEYGSRPTALVYQPTLPDVSPFNNRPDGPSRSTTQSSARSSDSYGSDAPLIGAAGPMGYDPSQHYSKPPPLRAASERARAYGCPLIGRASTASAQNTQHTYRSAYSSRAIAGRVTPSGALLSRQDSDNNVFAAPFSPQRSQTASPSTWTERPFHEYELRAQSPSGVPLVPIKSQYLAYNPGAPPLLHRPATATPPSRNLTGPHHIPTDYFFQNPPPQRSGTAPLAHIRSGTAPPSCEETSVNSVYDGKPLPPRPSVPARPATTGPSAANSRRRVPAWPL
ncbi:MAG: hypothetical protein L6R35_001443 [Caloplaca aegaea]|nr:MAG: hypothetical protein L6R35_001443 [Caloplaca aegaea]